MLYWNAVFLVAPLLFLQECFSISKFIKPSLRLQSFRETMTPTIWPICFINNKWRPCTGKPINYDIRAGTSPRMYNFTRSKPRPKQIALPEILDCLLKLPSHQLEKLRQPTSVAAGIIKHVANILPINVKLISDNNDILNPYHIRTFKPNRQMRVDSTTTTYMRYNITHSSLIDTDYTADVNVLNRKSSGAMNTIVNEEQPEPTITTEKQTFCPAHCLGLNAQYTTSAIESENNCTSCDLLAASETTPTDAEVIELPEQRKKVLLQRFMAALEDLDRLFYNTTFNKLLSISPPDRAENGINFVQSGVFLSMFLMVISTTTDTQTAEEIDKLIGVNFTDEEKKDIIEEIIMQLPKSDIDLRWRWSSRLVLGSHDATQVVNNSVAAALRLRVAHCDVNETPEHLAKILNRMVEEDSGGAIHATFEPDEFSEGFRAAAISMLYFRARWRSAPTVLNGTRSFRDKLSQERKTRMIRINDVMRYVNLEDWRCQAIEISYATPGLTLLLVVPDETSLRGLAERLTTTSVSEIVSRMESLRIAVSMPIYTLRMTLLLPSKLQSMGVNSLVDWNRTDSDLRLSHAVQRIMFWAEAGRHAFKDDGIEWDKTPELELVVDRPYLFFVRWHNLTLLNGNFVL